MGHALARENRGLQHAWQLAFVDCLQSVLKSCFFSACSLN